MVDEVTLLRPRRDRAARPAGRRAAARGAGAHRPASRPWASGSVVAGRRRRAGVRMSTTWLTGHEAAPTAVPAHRVRRHAGPARRRPGADLRRARRAGPERVDALGPVRRLVLLDRRQRRRDRRRLPRRAPRRSPASARVARARTGRCCPPTGPDVVLVAAACWRSGTRAPRTTCIPTWRCCSARRARPARPSWCGSRTTNLRSNAGEHRVLPRLTADDRAATTLPLHYCYGLSVVNSHLLVGRRPGAHRRVGRRRALLGPRSRRGTARPRSPGCPTPSTCSTRVGFAAPRPAGAALRHPGRRPHGAGAGPALRRGSAASAASTSS